MKEMRIDKYLWAVRLFKTRTIAADACKNGHVIVNEIVCKPSKSISGGESLKVKKGPVWREYKIKALLPQRVGAKVVGEYLQEMASEMSQEILA